jgi:hypothetical protein
VVAETQQRLPHAQVPLLAVLPSGRTAWATRTTAEINAARAGRYGRGRVAGVALHDPAALFLCTDKLDRTLFYDPLHTPPEPPRRPLTVGNSPSQANRPMPESRIGLGRMVRAIVPNIVHSDISTWNSFFVNHSGGKYSSCR